MSRSIEGTGAAAAPLWEVWVSQPFHLSGEAEQTRVGVFASCEEALATCRHLVDEFVEAQASRVGDAEALLAEWRESGPEPWIQPAPDAAGETVDCLFAAAQYARRRCDELYGQAAADSIDS
jgi:hypothetical protein